MTITTPKGLVLTESPFGYDGRVGPLMIRVTASDDDDGPGWTGVFGHSYGPQVKTQAEALAWIDAKIDELRAALAPAETPCFGSESPDKRHGFVCVYCREDAP